MDDVVLKISCNLRSVKGRVMERAARVISFTELSVENTVGGAYSMHGRVKSKTIVAGQAARRRPLTTSGYGAWKATLNRNSEKQGIGVWVWSICLSVRHKAGSSAHRNGFTNGGIYNA
jgi:hypothetical protein